MSTNDGTFEEQFASTGRRRDWRMFFAGAVAGCLLPLAVAFFYGPKSWTTYEDPLTGRQKEEKIWLGINLHTQIEENEVSNWADRNSIAGIYPAQYGWSAVTVTQRGWFTGTEIGCGGFGIPGRIYRRTIVIEGITAEETLQKYQTELIAGYHEYGTTLAVQRKWRNREAGRSPR